MNYKAIFQILLFTLASCVFGQQTKVFPKVELTTLDGKVLTTNEILSSEKPVVIAFWATWCKPCLEELNAIVPLIPEFETEYGVKFIAISQDDVRTQSRVKQLVEKKQWSHDVYLDVPNVLQKELNFSVIPYLVVLNSKKEIIYTHLGYKAGDELELKKVLQKLN